MFNKDVLIIKNLTAFQDKVLELRVIPGPDSTPEDLNIISWEVTAMTSRQLNIALSFENTLRISSQMTKDKLEISLVKNQFFIDEETIESIKPGTKL